MINNRLFKKFNAIFWGVLTWLPIVIFVLFLFKTSDISFNADYTPYQYISECIYGFNDVFQTAGDGVLYNPLTDLFDNFLYLIAPNLSWGTLSSVLASVCSWVCWVQVMRLFVYVFWWFIDLISGLFDLMSFNRKGDN